MTIETVIYLAIALVLMTLRRIISGIKNGAFYAKGNKYETPKLDKYINNLHFAETPAWYTQFGAVFFFLLAFFRASNPEVSFYVISIQLIASYLIMSGSSAMASYHFQGYINHGSNFPWVDLNENPKSEFAIKIGKKDISFWWNRPWCGKRRKYTPYLGVISIVAGFLAINLLT